MASRFCACLCFIFTLYLVTFCFHESGSRYLTATAVCNQPVLLTYATCCCHQNRASLLHKQYWHYNLVIAERIAHNLLLTSISFEQQLWPQWLVNCKANRVYFLLDKSKILKLTDSLWHTKHKLAPRHRSWNTVSQQLQEPRTHGWVRPPSLRGSQSTVSPPYWSNVYQYQCDGKQKVCL